MKKLINFIALTFILCTVNVCAKTVDVQYNTIYPEKKDGFDAYTFGSKSFYLSNFGTIDTLWWTGQEYIKENPLMEICPIKSNDLINWEEIDYSLPSSIYYPFEGFYRPEIKLCGDKYIIWDKIQNDPSDITSCLFEWDFDTLYWVPIRVFDENFQYIADVSFDDPISDFSYVDGIYYACTQKYEKDENEDIHVTNTVYRSEDAINWNADNNLINVPLSNGHGTTLFFDGTLQHGEYYTDYIYNMDKLSVSLKNTNAKEVHFENAPYGHYDVVGDLYISYYDLDDYSNSFKISEDGVYWVEIEFPEFEKNEFVRQCIEFQDRIMFLTGNRLLEYTFSDLHEAVSDNAPYIEINNKILGFDTAPVIENDRTLVPMRFLFEQMGADVDWNNDTKTATVEKDNEVISFSINNTTAKVNNQSKTMDVPARLINDKTMIPLRFLSESLGYNVEWNDTTRTAIISH